MFTRQWLCVRVLFVTVVSLFMTLVASGFDAPAFGRKEEFLLKNEVLIFIVGFHRFLLCPDICDNDVALCLWKLHIAGV